ncbi:hypothetical protein CDAR_204951 [Caerostris darwini]|uniref:Uncharacterized protein n=1 Tax=Caerostris darwini TaxID=1538125 RepID=A0AAV4SQT5_9ARAC|nr:hypothetical protein CDAR_204951 [Caerostris darwini]
MLLTINCVPRPVPLFNSPTQSHSLTLFPTAAQSYPSELSWIRKNRLFTPSPFTTSYSDSDSISAQPLTVFVGHDGNIFRYVLFIPRDGNHKCASEGSNAKGVEVFLERL